MVNEQVYRIVRLILGLLFAFFIMLHSRWNLIGDLLGTPSFYIALTVIFCMTYSLLYIIHIVTIQLDKYLNWKRSYLLRPLLQFVLGICIPLFIAVIYAHIHSIAGGYRFEMDTFWQNYFSFIAILVVFVNGFYPVFYFLIPLEMEVQSEHQPELTQPEPTMVVQYNGEFVTLGLLSDVLYFYRDGKLVKLHTVSGIDYAVHKPLAAIISELPENIYCQINRSTIINTTFLKGYSMLKRNSLQARFKMQYHPYIKDREDDRYKVTKEHIERFKELLQSTNADKLKTF